MRPGDIVTIYQDPITETKPEGKAKLVRRLSPAIVGSILGTERWNVEFVTERGQVYEREIRVGGDLS